MPIFQKEFNVTKPTYLGIGDWQLRNLNEVTVIFGKNGSGKSQLLRMIRDTDRRGCHYTSPERAGEINNDMSIAQQQFDYNKRAERSKKNFSEQFRQETVSRIQALLVKMGGAPAGTLLSSAKEDIRNFIRILLPDFDFRIKADSVPPFELWREKNGSHESVTSVNALSSGETEILVLALDLLTICCMWDLDPEQQQKILLIDEPDTHLHPDLQQNLAHFLIQLRDKYLVQIIVATHSTTLLSALGYYGQNKTSVLYLDSNNTEQRAVSFDDALKEVATCLGGHALMGPLFGTPILLVEGDDDYKIWSQAPRGHKIRVAVIPCNGEEIFDYQTTLEKIFNSLRSTTTVSGYAILDHDKALPIPNPDRTQNYIKYLRLECHESENLYISNEVLQTLPGNPNWDSAVSRIKDQALGYGNISEKLLGCDAWDRKTIDLKGLVGAIAKILDPNGTDWTIRVGKCIGSKRPDGQLYDFLGSSVVDVIWGSQSVEETSSLNTEIDNASVESGN
jgi:predicted ATPase